MEHTLLGFIFILCTSHLTPTAALSPALILTPFIAANQTKEARQRSLVNPRLFLNVSSHSGFLTVDERYGSNTFFWYFPLGDKAGKTPWILWLQGGPGATSLAGLFDELGPFEYDKRSGLKLREWAWSKDYSMLFFDNPIGAGYSFTNSEQGFAKNTETYTEHLYSALQQFLTIFPEMRKAPLYLAGESYAGHYIPPLVSKILAEEKKPGYARINLQGLILGNPVLDRESMVNYTALYYQWGLIDYQGARAFQPLQDAYAQAVRDGNVSLAYDLHNKIQDKLQDLSYQLQTYNVLADEYNFHDFEEYLNSEEIKEALHVGDIKFNFSNHTATMSLVPEFLRKVVHLVEELLEHYRLLIYCGQLDLTAPCVPNSEVRRETWRWSRRGEFLDAPRIPWWYNESMAGYSKSGGGLTEVLVRSAGHLVPIEKPAQTHQLISYFIEGIDIPTAPNFQSDPSNTPHIALVEDTESETTGNSSESKTEDPNKDIYNSEVRTQAGLIISVVINVVLVLIVCVGVFLYIRQKKRLEAFFYTTVDNSFDNDEIFMS